MPGDPVSLLVDGEGHVPSVGEGVDFGHHRVEGVEADPALDLVGLPVEDYLVADLMLGLAVALLADDLDTDL